MGRITRFQQLLLAFPAIPAAIIMSLSGLPGRRGLGDALRSNCDLSLHPSGFSPPYMFAPHGVRIDWGPVLTAPERLSCQLVTLFEAAAWHSSPPPHRVVLTLWLSYLPTILTLLHLTSHRHRVSWLPPLLGFYQWAAAALCFPLLSALLIPRLLPSSSPRLKPYTRSRIEGLILGLAAGYFLPSRHLLFSTVDESRQSWTLGWQFFPITVWLVQEGWVWIRRHRHNGKQSEHDNVNRLGWAVLGGLCGVPSVIAHMLLLSHLPSSLPSLIPSLHTSPSHTLLSLAHHTLAWDLFLTHLSVVLSLFVLCATLGRGRGTKAVSWRVVVGTVLGGLGVGIGWGWWVGYGREERVEIEKEEMES